MFRHLNAPLGHLALKFCPETVEAPFPPSVPHLRTEKSRPACRISDRSRINQTRLLLGIESLLQVGNNQTQKGETLINHFSS